MGGKITAGDLGLLVLRSRPQRGAHLFLMVRLGTEILSLSKALLWTREDIRILLEVFQVKLRLNQSPLEMRYISDSIGMYLKFISIDSVFSTYLGSKKKESLRMSVNKGKSKSVWPKVTTAAVLIIAGLLLLGFFNPFSNKTSLGQTQTPNSSTSSSPPVTTSSSSHGNLLNAGSQTTTSSSHDSVLNTQSKTTTSSDQTTSSSSCACSSQPSTTATSTAWSSSSSTPSPHGVPEFPFGMLILAALSLPIVLVVSKRRRV